MCREVCTLEEDIYRMDVREAEHMLQVFAEDEPSVHYILSNLYAGVRRQIIYGGDKQ